MPAFVRFTTTDDRIVHINPENIVMISEHRYRLNDIGYIGSTITFHVGTAATSINVKDDPDAIYHYLQKADLVHDQKMFLSLYKNAVPTHPPQKTQAVPSIEDFIDYIDNHPINQVDKPDPNIDLRIRSRLSPYRITPQEEPPCNGNGEAQSTEE